MTKFNRREALATIGVGSAALGLPSIAQAMASKSRPNIIFIMTDDHAQSALSCYGNPILQTPNLDRIGAEGIRFNEAFVTNSLCLPSRATYLTGLYSHTHGMITNGAEIGFFYEPGLINSLTWPVLLRRSGYHTGVVGKWHLPTAPVGYDYAAVLPGQGEYMNPEIHIQGRLTIAEGHTDDVIGNEALKFLDGRPSDQPFCLLYQFKAPHRSWEPAPRFAKAFDDMEIPVPDSFMADLSDRPRALRAADNLIGDIPEYRDRGVTADLPFEERARLNYQHFIKDYYRVLLGVDDNVGRLLDYLERNGLAENTLIVYTTDNGFFLGEHGMFDKRLMYEPSIRVPLLVRHPASIPAGQVNTQDAILNIDAAPTFLDFGGAVGRPPMHGRSWRPLTQLDKTVEDWREDFLYEYFEFPGAHCVRHHAGVRSDRWKYIEWAATGEVELYDLKSDPKERNNLSDSQEHAPIRERLKLRLRTLREETGDFEWPEYIPGDPEYLYGCEPLPQDG